MRNSDDAQATMLWAHNDFGSGSRFSSHLVPEVSELIIGRSTLPNDLAIPPSIVVLRRRHQIVL